MTYKTNTKKCIDLRLIENLTINFRTNNLFITNINIV